MRPTKQSLTPLIRRKSEVTTPQVTSLTLEAIRMITEWCSIDDVW